MHILYICILYIPKWDIASGNVVYTGRIMLDRRMDGMAGWMDRSGGTPLIQLVLFTVTWRLSMHICCVHARGASSQNHPIYVRRDIQNTIAHASARVKHMQAFMCCFFFTNTIQTRVYTSRQSDTSAPPQNASHLHAPHSHGDKASHNAHTSHAHCRTISGHESHTKPIAINRSERRPANVRLTGE